MQYNNNNIIITTIIIIIIIIPIAKPLTLLFCNKSFLKLNPYFFVSLATDEKGVLLNEIPNNKI